MFEHGARAVEKITTETYKEQRKLQTKRGLRSTRSSQENLREKYWWF